MGLAHNIGVCLLIALLSGLAQAQSPVDDSYCRKNVLIYFDTSHSMFKEISGRSRVIEDMISFLKQAIQDPDLLVSGDVVYLYEFVETVRPFVKLTDRFEVSAEEVTEVLRRIEPFENDPESIKDSGYYGNSNDYKKLIENISHDVRSTPQNGGFTNYVIVFTDLFYDATENTSRLDQQVRDTWRALQNLAADLAKHKYQMLVIYQQNPEFGSKEARDLKDVFSQTSRVQVIENWNTVDQIIVRIREELAERLKLEQPDTVPLYRNGQFELTVEITNDNCEEVRISSLQLQPERIDSPGLKYLFSSKEIPFTGRPPIPPRETREESIRLGGQGDTEALAKLVDQHYTVPYELRAQRGSTKGSLEIDITKETFYEDIKADPRIHFIDHLFNRFDKLLFSPNFEGRLLDEVKVTIDPKLPGFNPKPIAPASSALRLSARSLLKDQEQILVFQLIPDPRARDMTLERILENGEKLVVSYTFQRDDQSPFSRVPDVQPRSLDVTADEVSSYWFWEALGIVVLVVLSFGLHTYVRIAKR